MSVDYIGCKVHLTTEDGSYEGRVHNVDLVQKKISLKKVIVLPNGKELTGLHNFFSSDIVNLQVIDTKETPGKAVSAPQCSQINESAGRNEHLDNTELVESSQFNDAVSPDSTHYTGTVPSKPKKVAKPIYEASDVFIIPKLDDRYFEAVEDLQQQPAVGLCMEGIDLGRNGKLSLVQFSTKDKIYIFDVKSMGRKAFSNGIGDVIENENIVKIIHDCRALSDLLYHEYGLNLKNVFDTVVADVVVWKHRNHGNLPRSVISLPACMLEYLENIDPQTIEFIKAQEHWTKNDPLLWEERPLDGRLYKYADFKIRSLLELRDRQLYFMMEDFRVGVEEYLSTWRDKAITREKEHISAYASVPKSVNRPQKDIPVQSKEEEDTSEHYFDRDVITEPSYWSRDAWKEGRQFHEDDDNEKYAWYREMQSQQASATEGVAAGVEKEDKNDVRYGLTSRKPYKRHTQNITRISKRDETAVNSRHSETPDPDLESEDSVSNKVIENYQRLSIANNETSSQSSSSLQSSDTELPTTTTSVESSPYKAHSSGTSSPYRMIPNYIGNESPVKKPNSQIKKLTLKDISRDFKLTSQNPPPLISSDGSLEDSAMDRVPSYPPVFNAPMSYATAVSGEKPAPAYNRSESPSSGYGTRGRGRGRTIQYYRESPANIQRPEESPVAILQGNAVRCDFPSDSVVMNAPRGITVSRDTRVFGMTES